MSTDDQGNEQPGTEKAAPDSDVSDVGDAIAYCALCGTAGTGPPITWMLEVDPRRGAVHYCDNCAREHLRAIEGRLHQEWW